MKKTLALLSLFITLLVLPQRNAAADSALTGVIFEDGFDAAVAAWNHFAITEGLDTYPTAIPDYHQLTRYNKLPAYSGQSLYWINHNSSALAGVYRTVSVTPGAAVRLNAWTSAWTTRSWDSEAAVSTWARQRVGLDPTGGTDPTAPTVVWSLPANYIGYWNQLVVETMATSNRMTIFLSAYPNVPNQYNIIAYDDVVLMDTGLDAVPTAVPMPAPTVDPLLIGFVAAQGAAPGQQGYTGSPFAFIGAVVLFVLVVFLTRQKKEKESGVGGSRL